MRLVLGDGRTQRRTYNRVRVGYGTLHVLLLLVEGRQSFMNWVKDEYEVGTVQILMPYLI